MTSTSDYGKSERVVTPARRLWDDVRAAMAGVERDYTRGALPRAVLLLAVPMVLEMVMESVFGLVDVYFVGRLGPEAVAVVGITESMLSIVFAIAIGLSAAATAMVARRIGEGKTGDAATAAAQAIVLGIGASVVTGIAGFVFADDLLRLLGASATAVSQGAVYTEILLASSATIYLLFLINAIFRGAGDPMLALKVLWLANCVNIVLDPCLIFGWGPFPELGLAGAAVATAIGRGCGVALQLWILARGRGRLRLTRAHLRIDSTVLGRLLGVSSNGIAQYLIATASGLGLIRILALFGAPALAGYTISLRLIFFAILPSWGISNAAATLVGQNLGAGRPDRAGRAAWITGSYNLVFMAAVGLVFIVFAEPLISLFSADPEVVTFGVASLRWISYGFGFFAYGMVITMSFNGAGDTRTPTLINVACYWLWQLPLAYALAVTAGFGAAGVFAAIAISESTRALVSIAAFRRGRWQRQQI